MRYMMDKFCHDDTGVSLVLVESDWTREDWFVANVEGCFLSFCFFFRVLNLLIEIPVDPTPDATPFGKILYYS